MAFAVISTTLTLAAVFVPVAFQSGSTGRLFYEFGITLAIAVGVSSLVALSFTPMLCSRILRTKRDAAGHLQHGWFYRVTEPGFEWLNRAYAKVLGGALKAKVVVLLMCGIFA